MTLKQKTTTFTTTQIDTIQLLANKSNDGIFSEALRKILTEAGFE